MSQKYVTPKLDGQRVALRGRVLPEQHARATTQAAQHGMSLSEYLAALIDRDGGLSTKLDGSRYANLISQRPTAAKVALPTALEAGAPK